MSTLAFSEVPRSEPDFMQDLKKITDADTHPGKIDLGAGVYRNDQGQYHEFRTLQKAKRRLEGLPGNHDYNPTTGIRSFYEAARRLMFGAESPLIASNQIASVQTVAGTGANRTGAAFLKRNWKTPSGEVPVAYVGVPCWPNYSPLLRNAGFEVRTYDHFKRGDTSPNLDNVTQAAGSAPKGSIFVFQGCCHNPTGLDYSKDQWKSIANAMLAGQHFAFFDTAYQGFGSDTTTNFDDDVWGLRYLAENGIDMLVAQSFSKNMGLYSERVGALHVVCKNKDIAANVFDQLRAQIRWEYSSAPAYGACLVDIILNDKALYQEWQNEVQEAASRIINKRRLFHRAITQKYRTPGSWDHIVSEKGLFSYLTLTKGQISSLIEDHHVYLPPTGRINVAGLRDCSTVQKAAAAIDAVVRNVN